MYGAEKSQWRDQAVGVLQTMTRLVPVLPLASVAGETYGLLRAELEKSGRMIGSNDLWIGVHARTADLTRSFFIREASPEDPDKEGQHTNHCSDDQERGVEERRGSKFEVQAITGILNAVAKEQFVGEQLTGAIQYRLASQIFHFQTPFWAE